MIRNSRLNFQVTLPMSTKCPCLVPQTADSWEETQFLGKKRKASLAVSDSVYELSHPVGCLGTGIFFPNSDLSRTRQQWVKWSAFTHVAACGLTPAAILVLLCRRMGSDLAHVGGRSRGSYSDHSPWPRAIRGTLQEVVFLEENFRPCITLEIVAAKPSWKEMPGTQGELLQGKEN